MCYHGIYTFEKTQKSVQGLFGDIFVFPTIFRDNSLSMCLHREKLIEVVKNVCNAKRTPRFWKVFLMTKSQQLCRLEVVEQTTWLVWRLLIPIEKIVSDMEETFRSTVVCHCEPVAKRQKILRLWSYRVNFPWPSRKQPTTFIKCHSNIVFLSCLFLSATTDRLASVELVW